MGQILVRGVDDDVLSRLRARAEANSRSLEGEARLILEAAAAYSPHEARKIFASLDKRFGGRKFSDSSDLIAEDRRR